MPSDPADSNSPAEAPPGVSPSRFRAVALASGLLSRQQFDDLEAELRRGPWAAREAHDPAGWDKALAHLAVHKKWITKFQAQELRRGRRRFSLGQYLILDEIGRGGMGQVFKAEHGIMGRIVAVKVLPRAKSTPETEAVFHREIRMLARLDHENLVRALDAGHDGNVSFLVTEYVPGLDLRRQVAKYGPLDESQAASVISQAARGLAYAHEQGLVHRDVKPGNLLVTREGRVKVLDLGLAGSFFEAESMRLGRCVGTMDYMAPEQIREPDTVGPAADIYALGCTLFYIVTGQLPFPGGDRKEKARRHLEERPRSVLSIAPRIAPQFARVIEAMMEKNPNDRIATAADVIGILRTWTPAVPTPMPRQARSADGTTTEASSSTTTATAATGTGSSGFVLGDPAGIGAASPLETVRDAGLQDTSDAAKCFGRGGAGQGWSDRLADGVALARRVGGIAIQGLARALGWLNAVVDGRAIAKAAIDSLLLAAPVGVAFGFAIHAVSQLNPELARRLLRDGSPWSLGWAAFALVAAAQFLASFGRRGRS